MRTYLLYFFACLRLSDINVKPIKKEERHHYSCAKVVFLFQKNVQQSEKKLLLHQIWQKYTPKRLGGNALNACRVVGNDFRMNGFCDHLPTIVYLVKQQ